MEIEYILVLVTVPTPETGRAIANHLLEEKLAACINILPSVRSLYSWKGAVHDDTEALLVIKSRLPLFERLSAAVKSLHPYETPEIIALPILAGSAEYLAWIGGETAK